MKKKICIYEIHYVHLITLSLSLIYLAFHFSFLPYFKNIPSLVFLSVLRFFFTSLF